MAADAGARLDTPSGSLEVLPDRPGNAIANVPLSWRRKHAQGEGTFRDRFGKS